jgi:hypothetical protein
MSKDGAISLESGLRKWRMYSNHLNNGLLVGMQGLYSLLPYREQRRPKSGQELSV